MTPQYTPVSPPVPLERRSSCPLPRYLSHVNAGFPAPATDRVEESLDLNEFLVDNPSATFFVRVRGHAMEDHGVHAGDVLIVDRAKDPDDQSIVIAVTDGSLTVHRLRTRNGRRMLVCGSKTDDSIPLDASEHVAIWGVVTNVIHSL